MIDRDVLHGFLSLPLDFQLAAIDSLPIDDVWKVHEALAEDPSNFSLDLLQCIQERLDADDNKAENQHRDLRERLTPEGLARMRAATYDDELLPLLNASEKKQQIFLVSLDSTELSNLGELIKRYMRETGHSARAQEFLSGVLAQLKQRK